MTTTAPLSAAPRAPQAPEADSVEREQLRMLFEHMAVGTFLATAFAILLAAHLYDVIPSGQLWTWLGLKLGVALPRMAQLALYRRRRIADPQRWLWITCALLAADGLVWGLGGLWFTQGPMVEAAVVAACLCSVACVATFGLQVSFKATSAYVVPMMAFTAIGMLARGADLGLVPSAGLALVLLLMLSTAKRAERRLLEVFHLRLLAQQIAEERAQAVVVLEGHSEQKSRFLATVSHEVRSPLHGIISLAELLDHEVAEPSARHKVELITSTGRHLLTLVSDLLDMSKIEAGTLRLDPKVFDLSAELAQFATLYEVRARQAGIHLHTRFMFPTPLRVVGDSGRVRQVLDNLVSNAIKFTPRGGSVSLTVTLFAERGVEFVVSDTGPGISKADQARLFRPFEQGSAAPEKAREGAGLGLAIARDLVAFMQGHLSCESEVGHGSSFRCLLPLPLAPTAAPMNSPTAALMTAPVASPTASTMAAAAAEPQAKPGMPAHPVRPAGPSTLALVVDDDEVSALVASAALQRAGWTVEVAHDGRVALERLTSALGRERPRLVLMDCGLPQLDGLETTRQVRAWETRTAMRPVRIVALTGRATQEDRAACLQAGMDDVFTKPFSMAALAEAATRHAPSDASDASEARRPAARERRDAAAVAAPVSGDQDAPVAR
ncbi:MAG: response regulator [Rubrivivax sp.]|nr:response regulator [Rubrivivax sp.]